MSKSYYGSIEAGGTKFVCSIATRTFEIVERVSFPTTQPAETLAETIDFFKKYAGNLSGIGIGSFGPIDVDPNSPTYGFITSTPKVGWGNFNFLGTMKQHIDVPMFWTTDVNAAAYGEYVFGKGREASSLVYYTIGTGVGGGAIQDGKFIEGFSHPEMGHMLVVPHPEDTYTGNCPFHQTCLEGMAAGPAIEKRVGIKGQELETDHLFWEHEAYYLAQCIYNTTLMLSPNVIILGGGVMKQRHLLEKIRSAFKHMMNNYVKVPDLDTYIVSPELEDNAGTFGCLALVQAHLES